MHAVDILTYGQQTVLQAIADFPDMGLNASGACGSWSVTDILAHLTSYEEVLVDILATCISRNPSTPALDRYIALEEQFNAVEVEKRKGRTVREVLGEFAMHHAQAMALAQDIPTEVYLRTGMLPWYGSAYSLDDVIVYMYYGHKREHSAQIQLMRARLSHQQ